jgi:predicted esterase
LLTSLVLGLLSLTWPVHAQEPASGKPGEIDKEKILEYIRLNQGLHPLFEEKKFEEAADICRKMIELIPRSAEPHYNLACAHAQLGRKDEALSELEKSVELGFEDSEHILKDDDLTSLRTEPRFTAAVAKARVKEAQVEKGEEIEGVKTVEGAPAGGLRFRVRMSPTATKEKPQRLIVWMHPSGGSMDAAVEKLAPRFAQHGFAVVVFTKKNYGGWGPADVARLPKTLDALAAIEGLSDDRPVLMGFSAGGQMALMLWRAGGAGLGGLILNAAYPVIRNAEGQFDRMELPEDAARKVPMFVVVGEKDGGSQVWKQMEATFRAAGTPVTLSVVEGRGHEWLFGENELQALDIWLEELGKTSDRAPAKGWRPKPIE